MKSEPPTAASPVTTNFFSVPQRVGFRFLRRVYGAGKLVAANIGPKDERWSGKETVEHEGQTFAEAMAMALKKESKVVDKA